jgi:hypothetical protein
MAAFQGNAFQGDSFDISEITVFILWVLFSYQTVDALPITASGYPAESLTVKSEDTALLLSRDERTQP